MTNWDKSDIGKILVYRKETGFKDEDEIIAILSVDSRVPNTVRFVKYPIRRKPEVGYLGLLKSQEKENRKYLMKPGDWFYMDNVTEKEKLVLEEIVESSKVLLDEE